jgi:hypothetical protein
MFFVEKKGQTSVEYLLIIVAGIMITTMVFVWTSGLIGSISEPIQVQGEKIIISLLIPDNHEYEAGEIIFTYNISSIYPIKDCNLIINEEIVQNKEEIFGGQTNFFRKDFTGYSLGEHEWSVSCKDNKNNFVKANSKKFFIVEKISDFFIQLLEPNNKKFAPSEIIFSFIPESTISVKDCNLLIRLDGETNFVSKAFSNNINTNTENTFKLHFSGDDLGKYEWNVSCNDEKNNTRIGEPKNFEIIAIDIPNVLLHQPDGTTYLTGDNIDFNYTPSHSENIKECRLEVGDDIIQTETNITNNSVNSFTVSNNDYSFGTHNWNVFCEDDSGNAGQGDSKTFEIIHNNPSVQLNSPNNGAQFQKGNNITFDYTPTHSHNIKQCQLKVNGNIIETKTNITRGSVNSFTILNNQYLVGTYNWNVFCEDDFGYIGQGTQRTFQITPPTITVTLFSPSSGITISTDTYNFSFTPSSTDFAIDSCKLYINHNEKGTLTSISHGMTNVFSNVSMSGLPASNTWYVRCWRSGFSGTSSSRSFTRSTGTGQVCTPCPTFRPYCSTVQNPVCLHYRCITDWGAGPWQQDTYPTDGACTACNAVCFDLCSTGSSPGGITKVYEHYYTPGSC